MGFSYVLCETAVERRTTRAHKKKPKKWNCCVRSVPANRVGFLFSSFRLSLSLFHFICEAWLLGLFVLLLCSFMASTITYTYTLHETKFIIIVSKTHIVNGPPIVNIVFPIFCVCVWADALTPNQNLSVYHFWYATILDAFFFLLSLAVVVRSVRSDPCR